MNNNFNQMGQFGGWTPSPYGYGSGSYSEQYDKYVQKKKDKSTIRKIANWCGLAVITYIVSSYVFSVPFAFLMYLFPSFGDTKSLLALDIIITFLAIGLPFFLMHLLLKKKKISKELPLGKIKDKKVATYLVMMFLPAMVVGALTINLISSVFQSMIGIEFTAPVNEIKMDGIGETIVGFVAVAVVPAFVEELAIRGALMQPLRKFGDKFAIITSAMVFAIMHGNLVQIPYTILGGLLLGYLAVVTESLWPSIILHFLNNFYSVIVMCVSDNFSDRASTIAALVMIVLFGIIGVIGAVKYTRRKYNNEISIKDEILSGKEKTKAFIVNAPIIISIILLFINIIVNTNSQYGKS